MCAQAAIHRELSRFAEEKLDDAKVIRYTDESVRRERTMQEIILRAADTARKAVYEAELQTTG